MEVIIISNIVLKRFFSKRMLHDISRNNDELFDYVIKRYVQNPEGKTYYELIDEIYVYISKEYRTEYFYKNTLLNKLLFKNHNYNSTSVLTELPIGNAKADFIMINGKAVVYEIKTELDNLDRLQCQIEDYYRAFTEVVIVTHSDYIERAINLVPEYVGIIELTKRQALKTIRKAIIHADELDATTIFKVLRKKEFESILLRNGKTLPTGNQFIYYRQCLELLKQMSTEVLQKEMQRELKKRTEIKQVEFCLSTPEDLHFLTYFDNSLLKESEILAEKLGQFYGGQ